MNIKKVFASLTGVLMLATTVTPLVTGAAHYGAELEGAYAYAYSKSITTMPSIDSANMYGDLTRAELAKMISNWAENELGQKPDLTQLCSFADEGEVYGDLPMYLKKACQMGLMGRGLVKFRPNDKVTRAEFGTTLSRALWGSKYEGGNPYYVNHLQALRDEGIMKMITTPSQLEKRGYVMLMLQRSSARKDAVNCADPMVTLACSVGGENCPAACKKAETVDNGPVKAGDLRVTATPAVNRRALLSGMVSDLDTITLQASEAVNLQRVTLERYGYSNQNIVANVWLEDENGVEITEKGTLNKDQVTLRVKRDYRNLSNKVQFTIVLQTKSDAVDVRNGTIGFKVKDVVSSAKNLDISAYTPYEYDLVKYDGSAVTLTPRGKVLTHNYEPNTMFEVGRFQLQAPSSRVVVKGLTLTNTGTLNLDRYFDRAEVLVDNTALTNVRANADRYGEKLTLSFDPITLDYNKRVNFLVNLSLKDLDVFGNVIAFTVSDVNAYEAKTNTRVSVMGKDKKLAEYTFGGGQIRLTNTKLPSVIDAAKGSLNVVVGEGKLDLARVVRLNGFKFADVQNLDKVQSVRFVVGNEEYDGVIAGNEVTFKPITLEKSATVKFVVDLKDGNQGDAVETVDFKKEFSKALFKKSESSYEIGKYDEARAGEVLERDFIGSISLSKVRLQPAKGNLYNNLTKDVEFVAEQTSKREIFNGEYIAKNHDVTLTDFVITGGSQLLDEENIDFTLSIDGKVVGTKNLVGGQTATGDESMSHVLVKKGQKVKVVLEAAVYGKINSNGDKNERTFKLQLKGMDSDSNPAGESKEIAAVKIVVVNDGSVIVSEKTKSQVVLKNSNLKLADFNVKAAKDAEVTLSKMEFEFTGNLTEENLRLNINGNISVTNTTPKKIVITDINEAIDADRGIDVELSHQGVITVGDYKLKLVSVNGVKTTRTFDKKVVSAIVSVKKMENFGDLTKFTLSVEKSSNTDVVKDLTIAGLKDANLQGEFNDGDEIHVDNADDTQYATSFTYTVGEESETVINKSDYRDFFLLNGQPLRAFIKK